MYPINIIHLVFLAFSSLCSSLHTCVAQAVVVNIEQLLHFYLSYWFCVLKFFGPQCAIPFPCRSNQNAVLSVRDLFMCVHSTSDKYWFLRSHVCCHNNNRNGNQLLIYIILWLKVRERTGWSISLREPQRWGKENILVFRDNVSLPYA